MPSRSLPQTRWTSSRVMPSRATLSQLRATLPSPPCLVVHHSLRSSPHPWRSPRPTTRGLIATRGRTWIIARAGPVTAASTWERSRTASWYGNSLKGGSGSRTCSPSASRMRSAPCSSRQRIMVDRMTFRPTRRVGVSLSQRLHRSNWGLPSLTWSERSTMFHIRLAPCEEGRPRRPPPHRHRPRPRRRRREAKAWPVASSCRRSGGALRANLPRQSCSASALQCRSAE
mmetsp:Transcript_102928/g.266093  ORF Transcript_102928/g.266093 Transcript_102928/m.266093 type:complete len:229 (+) Transcript_102928:1975-2661(+)